MTRPTHRPLRLAAGMLAACALLAGGCATRFSPEMIRDEIAAQRGQDPLGVFELNLGRFTTFLLKSALADETTGELPFAGLDQLQLAVYEAPAEAGPAIDVTRIVVRGWDPVVRVLDERRSGMVLIRPAGDRIGDLVVVGAGGKRVVYARLRGLLDPTLPERMGTLLREGGPEEVQRVLSGLDGSPAGR